MNVFESFKIALSSIWNHKIRSILTMLGIIIGVCAVIVIVAIGTGAKDQLTDDFFGADKNVIELYYEWFPDEDGSDSMAWYEPEITSADLAEIQKVPGVKVAMGINNGWGTLIANDKQIEMQIIGISRDYFYGKSVEILEGRPFTEQDNDNMNRVIMIDDYTRDKLFKEDEDVIGEIVEIDGNPYKLVGVYKSPIPEEYRWDEGEGLMPRTLNGMMFGSPEIQQVQVLADNPETLVQTGEMAAARLTELKELEDGMYTFWDMTEYEEEMDSFYMMMTLFIGSIAGISLFVGGIGVMNIMLVSVTERTREIGLRKAIGATRKRILLQFLIEAMTLTSLGGILGIVFAMGLTTIASQFLPFSAAVSPIVAILGVAFSASIGIVFGILPANKASKLSPIDALRHE